MPATTETAADLATARRDDETRVQVRYAGTVGELWGARYMLRGKNVGKVEIIIGHRSLGNRKDPSKTFIVEPSTLIEITGAPMPRGHYFTA